MNISEPNKPIYLSPDDGLRLVATGTIIPKHHQGEGYRYIIQANPGLVAEVLAERRHREMIHETNLRRFS